MRLAVLLAALVLWATSAFAAPGFTTRNGRIYYPDGTEFVAKGANIPGFNSWVGRDPSNDVGKFVDWWGLNTARVNCQPVANWQSPGYGIDLDRVIRNYTARGVVTIIEAHESTGKYFEGETLTRVADWFAGLAAKYRDNPYVWFNTGNEPGNATKPTDPAALAAWDQWTPDGPKYLTMQRTIAAAIRGTGNTAPIVFDDSNYGQGQAWDDRGNLVPKHSAVLTYGPTLAAEFSNSIFSLHIYGEWSSRGAVPDRLNKYIDATRAAGLPLIVGEWGTTIWQDWQESSFSAFKVLQDRGIGRLAWGWNEVSGWHLTTDVDPAYAGRAWGQGGGYLVNDQHNPTNLTEMGALVWGDTHPSPPVPEPVVLGVAGVVAMGMRRRRAA